jgi:hypothetical protein
MRNKISWISKEEVISAFSVGVSDIKMKEKLSMNDELTSVVGLFEITDRCAKAEEGRLFVPSAPEAAPLKSKLKDPKRKETAILAAEPEQKHHRNNHSEHDKGGRHQFCILHKRDMHNTNAFWVVRKFHEEHGVTKRRGGGRSYSRGGTRGKNHYEDHDEGNRRDDPPRADAELLPQLSHANDHHAEN